jgi:radical SAM superfamily enzyme YgiQ (UPF0313 family)
MKKRLLLVNPWIFDFTAYDLWSKPLGLLYIASFLRQFDFDIFYIDCLDKYDQNGQVKPDIKIKKYGTGHYTREVVHKPEILKHIPRRYARYGITENEFIASLHSLKSVDAILVTSHMTYWYQGVERVVQLCRQYLPQTPIILGGIYATLLPEHARKIINPDYLIRGPGEMQVLELLSSEFNIDYEPGRIPQKLDDFPYPAFDLINHPDYLIMMTSRGCPYHCLFCAQKLIARPFEQRSSEHVVEEFKMHYRTFGIRDFAFYDDALFVNKKTHIEPILEHLIASRLPLRLHSPNGLFANAIDERLADLMYRSHFKTVRLSFETSDVARQKDMHAKVSNEKMTEAVGHLIRAGFKARDIEAYVLMGLPDQTLQEIISSIIFIHNLGLQIKLASFSPIPGTLEFERAVTKGYIEKDIDPLLTNKTIYPLHNEQMTMEIFRQIRVLAQILNQAALQGLSLFDGRDIGRAVLKVIKQIHE